MKYIKQTNMIIQLTSWGQRKPITRGVESILKNSIQNRIVEYIIKKLITIHEKFFFLNNLCSNIKIIKIKKLPID